jgi:hypothetical protein
MTAERTWSKKYGFLVCVTCGHKPLGFRPGFYLQKIGGEIIAKVMLGFAIGTGDRLLS